jgi:hypothetical protein
MPRPLMQHGIGQLEELFARGKADPSVLKQLESELRYRQVPRAVTLLSQVQGAMYGSNASRPPPTTVTEPTTRPLFPTTPATEPVIPLVSPSRIVETTTVHSASASVTAAGSEPTPRPAAPMPLAEAYKLLKATPSSTWETIEKIRREVVQQSHPERLKLFSPEKRSEVLSVAERTNDAYIVLSRDRCAGH